MKRRPAGVRPASAVMPPTRRASLLGPASVLLLTLLLLLSVLTGACGSGSPSSDAQAPSEPTSAPSSNGTPPSSLPADTGPRRLLIATAASLKEVFTEIGQAFDAAHDCETSFTFDSSGALQKQIENGAPADVFASAAMTQVKNLLDKNLVDEPSITVFAGNEIVLAVPAASDLQLTSFEDLVKPEVRRVTTADPAAAPQGKAAMEILTHLQVVDQVQPKLIYAKNALQTLAYVVQAEVDAGLMFSTDARTGGDKVKVVATSEPSWHGKIEYVFALVSAGKAKPLAQEFVDFAKGPEGRSILEKYGFTLPPAS